MYTQATSPAAERRHSEWDTALDSILLRQGAEYRKEQPLEMREAGPLLGGLKGFAVCGLGSGPAHGCSDPA